jgi:MFS family permease
MAFAAGSAIAPVLGGKLSDVYGFRETFDIIATLTFCFAMINFAVVFLPTFFCLRHPDVSK